MKQKIIWVLGIMLAFQPGKIISQEKWSLEKCIQHALENNITVKQQELNTQYQENALFQSKMSILPSFNASGGYSASYGRALDQTTYQFTNNQTIKSINASLSGNMTLFNGLQKYNLIRENRFNLLSSLKDLEKLRNDISLNVASAYLQILFSMELVQNAQSQLDVTKLQVDRTSKLVDAGSLPMGNLLEVQSQQASEDLQLTTYQNQLDIAYLTLTQMLELDSVGNFKIEVPDFSKIGDEEILSNVNEIFSDALNSLPQISSAEYKLKSSEAALAVARGAMSPRLYISTSYGSGYSDVRKKTYLTGGTISYPIGVTASGETVTTLPEPATALTDYPLNMQLRDNKSTTVMVGLSIPIFNGWQVRSNISNSKIGVLNSQYSLDNTRKLLYKDIQQAYADAVASIKKYKSTEKALSSMRESFKYTEQKYEVGMITTVDYYTAKNQLAMTESNLLQAKYDYIFKRSILDFYRGRQLKL